MQSITFEFETKRLRVFAVKMESPTPINGTRIVYTGWDRHVDLGHPAVMCVVLPEGCIVGLFDPFLEWVETMDDQRRQGFATELLSELVKRHPRLYCNSVTPSGISFMKKFFLTHEMVGSDDE